jgi:hypothetical protein
LESNSLIVGLSAKKATGGRTSAVRGTELHDIQRQPFDRLQALPRAADDGNSDVAQEIDPTLVHDAGPHRHQIMRLHAFGRGLGQNSSIIEFAAGAAKRLIVGRIAAAEDDGIGTFVGIERGERRRHIGTRVAGAPSIERVAVAGNMADLSLYAVLDPLRQRRQRNAGCSGDVENELGLTAGRREHIDIAAARPSFALAGCEDFGEFVEICDLDRAMRREHLREHARFAGKAPRVTRDRPLRARAAPDLENDDRLARRRSAIESRDIFLRLADGLAECRNDFRGGIVDEIIDIGRGIHNRFVAAGDDEAETEAPEIGEHSAANRTALRDEADIAGKARRVAQRLLECHAAGLGIEHAHAIRATEGDSRFVAETRDLVLEPPAFVAEFGEAAVVDDRGTAAAARQQAQILQHA